MKYFQYLCGEKCKQKIFLRGRTMRKLKRAAFITLALTMAFSMAACGGGGGTSSSVGGGTSSSSSVGGGTSSGNSTEELGVSKLYVGVWDGGVRANWVETWAADFEEKYKDHSFEEGKKGVKIELNVSKAYLDDRMTQELNDKEDEIVFGEQGNYYKFLENKTAYDISEWVTTPLEEFGETRSIADKLSPYDQDYFGQSNNEYYGLPWVNSILAINYDMKLFEDRNYYFAAPGEECDEYGLVYDPETPRAYGPDGRTGVVDGVDYSVDDGLPATYDDFFKLCDKMYEDGVTPFIWAGGFQKYVTQLLYTLAADFEGFDDMQLNYTFDGKEDGLLDLDKLADGIVEYLDEVEINDTNDNGWMLRQQEGMYQAMKFLHRLITTLDDNGERKYYNPDDCFGDSMSHTGAQSKFLTSEPDGNPIAMFIDGTWWYNEAYAQFDYMASTPGYGHYERQIGMMPIPKATKDKVGEDATWMSIYITTVVVNSNVKNYSAERLELIKTFFRFIHTDKALSTYVRDSHTVRPFSFELTGVTEDELSPYALQQFNILKKSQVVKPYASHWASKNYLNDFHNVFQTTYGYDLVTEAFNDGITAEEFFIGWNEAFGQSKWDTFIPGTDGMV